MTTTPVLPAGAARLTTTLNAEHLAAELQQVNGHAWKLQQGRAAGGQLGAVTDIDWRVLPLRAPNGDAERTDPGGPGPDTCAATEWLDRMPYLAEVIDAIPAPLNAARLMALGPGAVGERHCDPKYALARLHIPIVTNPDAILLLDGIEYYWQPGEFWYGDFSREHAVRNLGTTTRVHAIIDVLFTAQLAALLPADWQDRLADADALINRPTPTSTDTVAVPLPYEVLLPAGFTDFGRDDQVLDGPLLPAHLHHQHGRLMLASGGRDFALLPVGDGQIPLLRLERAAHPGPRRRRCPPALPSRPPPHRPALPGPRHQLTRDQRTTFMQLHSHDDFTLLREVIVGSATNYVGHDRDVSFELFHHENLTGLVCVRAAGTTR
ncbi:aspartyl/asparaginyl beta-hydroxylase domain-containing protein [Streptomyces sp. NPDC097981]|uniref:aspartyl/asparaginyl beta-hydroxylase domain-containing protein n=1 Tax=Streptomyces sp. NPDC097981 TaxID=3155428 RepID=UPI003329DF7E